MLKASILAKFLDFKVKFVQAPLIHLNIMEKRAKPQFVQITFSCQTLWVTRLKVFFSDLCCWQTPCSTSGLCPSLLLPLHPSLLQLHCLRGLGLVITGLEQGHTTCIHTLDTSFFTRTDGTHAHLRTAFFNNIQRETTTNPLPFMD